MLRSLVAAALFLLSAPVLADAALDRLMAEARAAGPQGFERQARIETPGRAAVVRIDRFDPAAPAGRQWTLVSIDGRPPTEEERSAHARQVAGQPVPGFHRLPVLLAGPPTSRREDAGRIVYRWDRLQRGAAPTGQGPDFSERLAAEATVATVNGRPVLQQVRVFAPQSFAIMGVARMNRFEAVTSYRFAGNGHRLERQQTEVDARVPLRASGAIRTSATFSAI